MSNEFKKFLARGNVIDLAVAVVMGSAFGAIVTGLVNDIVMPIIGFLTAGIDFSDLKIVLSAAQLSGAGEVLKPEVAITYGHLLQVTLQFVIIAACVFLVIRGINKVKAKAEEKKEPAPKAPVQKPQDILLLEEIRDLLKKP